MNVKLYYKLKKASKKQEMINYYQNNDAFRKRYGEALERLKEQHP